MFYFEEMGPLLYLFPEKFIQRFLWASSERSPHSTNGTPNSNSFVGYLTSRNPAIITTNVFTSIIDPIQTSNINYHLQLSPFSAFISVKRSLVKEKKSRAHWLPETPVSREPSLESVVVQLVDRNLQLERKLKKVKVQSCKLLWQLGMSCPVGLGTAFCSE